MANRTISTTPPVSGSTFISEVSDKFGSLFNAMVLLPISVSNIGNDYTIIVDPVLGGDVVPGMAFFVKPNVVNTGNVRLRVSDSNPYYSVYRLDGTHFPADEFKPSIVWHLVYAYGGFVVLNSKDATATRIYDTQIFTGSGTWNKPAGLPLKQPVKIQCWGAGGGGSAVASNCYGGGGGYFERIMTVDQLSTFETVAIGIGGIIGVGLGPGGNGGNTTFGSHVTANGGRGGYFNGIDGQPGESGSPRGIVNSTVNPTHFWDGGGNAIWGAGAGNGGTSVFGGQGGKHPFGGVLSLATVPGGGGHSVGGITSAGAGGLCIVSLM